MPVIAYLAPLVEVPFAGTTLRTVASASVLRDTSGWQRLSLCPLARQPLRALAPVVVRRDTLSNAAWEAAVPAAIRVGEGDTFAQIFTSVEALSLHPLQTRLVEACDRLGVDRQGVTTLGPLVARLWRHFEPAAHAEMFAGHVRLGPQTITDNFNRADGGLGAGWEELEGATWAVVSNQARSTAGPGLRTARRTEAAFPNDQYVQLEIEWTGAGNSAPGVRVAADGDCYAGIITGTTANLYEHTGGGGVSEIDSAALVTAIDTFFTALLEAVGTSITFDIDGAEQCSATSSAFASGKPGLLASVSNVDVDDFESTDAFADDAFLTRGFPMRGAVKRAAFH